MWFAAWFVAGRYVSVDFYKFELGEAVQVAFGLSAACMAVALIIMPFIRPRAGPRLRWTYGAFCLASLLVAELVWRLVMDDVPWDVAKGLGIILDVLTPALLALGGAAIVSEWRASRPIVENGAIR